MELLAPAGNLNAFFSAVAAGADAVYLGGVNFSARRSADNFDDELLRQTVIFAHKQQVKLYVTVNILLKDEELLSAINYLAFLESIKIDGVIIQDFGLLYLAKLLLPNLNIHASTQMTIMNSSSIEFLAPWGIKKYVLARETSLAQISQIYDKTKASLEVFAHGALCIALSGQCLLSSMIGGRSGNRGACAQPCRLQYQILKNGKPLQEIGKAELLSPKDLNALALLNELAEAGVATIKLEGRMKGPEYVYTVTKAYRAALDQGAGLENSLHNVFNRGFTTGYLLKNQGKDLISVQEPQREMEAALIKDTEAAIKNLNLTESFAMRIAVSGVLGQKLKVAFTVEEQCLCLESEITLTKAEKQGLTAAKISEQLGRLGGTPFYLEGLEFSLAENLMLPVSQLNQLRRSAVAYFTEQRLKKPSIVEFSEQDLSLYKQKANLPKVKPALLVKVSKQEAVEYLLAKNIEHLIIPILHEQNNEKQCKLDEVLLQKAQAAGSKIWISLSPILLEDEQKELIVKLQKIYQLGFKNYIAANLGHVAILQALGEVKIALDEHFNCFNSMAVEAFATRGDFAFVSISPELTQSELKGMKNSPLPLALTVHGKANLMVSKHCIIGASIGNKRADSPCTMPCKLAKFSLQDKMQYEFPLQMDEKCTMYLKNAKTLCLLTEVPKLVKLGLAYFILDCQQMDIAELAATTIAYKLAIKEPLAGMENSLSALRENLEMLSPSGFTRGHLHRKVE